MYWVSMIVSLLGIGIIRPEEVTGKAFKTMTSKLAVRKLYQVILFRLTLFKDNMECTRNHRLPNISIDLGRKSFVDNLSTSLISSTKVNQSFTSLACLSVANVSTHFNRTRSRWYPERVRSIYFRVASLFYCNPN